MTVTGPSKQLDPVLPLTRIRTLVVSRSYSRGFTINWRPNKRQWTVENREVCITHRKKLNTNVTEKSRRNKNREEEQKFRSTSTVHDVISETKSVPWKKAGTKLELRIRNSASSLRFSRRCPCGSIRTHYRHLFIVPRPCESWGR